MEFMERIPPDSCARSVARPDFRSRARRSMKIHDINPQCPSSLVHRSPRSLHSSCLSRHPLKHLPIPRNGLRHIYALPDVRTSSGFGVDGFVAFAD